MWGSLRCSSIDNKQSHKSGMLAALTARIKTPDLRQEKTICSPLNLHILWLVRNNLRGAQRKKLHISHQGFLLKEKNYLATVTLHQVDWLPQEMVSRAVVETFLGALILAFGACGIVINVTAVVILMRRYTSPTAAMKRHLVAQGKESLNFSQFRIYYAKKRKRSSVFHQLLKLLSIYDILVCICACLAYGFPNVWATYQHQVMPKISVWLSPIIHIALMSSVFCTVTLSFERYVRICYICQMKVSWPLSSGWNQFFLFAWVHAKIFATQIEAKHYKYIW